MSISFSKVILKNFLLDLFDIITFLVYVGGIVLFVRFFLFNPYTVVGASMQPTFEENDFILVDKISPRVSQWQRGDIIVFVPPQKDFPYIKRIIGLPGETIKIEEGRVYVCQDVDDPLDRCEMLDEQYLPDGLNTEARCTKNVFEVDQSGVFVLGDNRGYSTDSRCCFGLGCYQGAQHLVPYDHIIGKVRVRVFPGFDFY